MDVHKTFLKAMARRAEALEEAIDKAGSVERSAILDVVSSQNLELLDLKLLRRNLQVLRLGANAGAVNLKRTRPGPRGDEESLTLLVTLFDLNVRAFGPNAPRITKASKYEGRFFDFAKEVFQMFEIDKTDDALGRAIENAIKIEGRKRNRQSP